MYEFSTNHNKAFQDLVYMCSRSNANINTNPKKVSKSTSKHKINHSQKHCVTLSTYHASALVPHIHLKSKTYSKNVTHAVCVCLCMQNFWFQLLQK